MDYQRTSEDSPPPPLLSPSPQRSPSAAGSPYRRSFPDFDVDLRSPSPFEGDNLTDSRLYGNKRHSVFDIYDDNMFSASSGTITPMAGTGPVNADDPMVIDTESENGDINPHNPEGTFYPFLKLHEDIRNRVWALNLPGPRLVEVIWKEGDKEDGWYTNAPIIANLSVCRDSRTEALKTHKLSFPCDASPARISFNFDTDTLLLGRKMVDTHRTFKKERHGTDLEKVQYLMVDAHLSWGRREKNDRGYGNFGHISYLIFKSVKEHTVLYTGNVDPLPFWAERWWFLRIVYTRWQHHDPVQSIIKFKQNWPVMPGRLQLSSNDAEECKKGGLPDKFDPAISCWRVPKVYYWGVPANVRRGFEGSQQCDWAVILMDRVIEDIFT